MVKPAFGSNPGSRGSGVGRFVLEARWDVAVGVQDAQDVEVVRLLEVVDEARGCASRCHAAR